MKSASCTTSHGPQHGPHCTTSPICTTPVAWHQDVTTSKETHAQINYLCLFACYKLNFGFKWKSYHDTASLRKGTQEKGWFTHSNLIIFLFNSSSIEVLLHPCRKKELIPEFHTHTLCVPTSTPPSQKSHRGKCWEVSLLKPFFSSDLRPLDCFTFLKSGGILLHVSAS